MKYNCYFLPLAHICEDSVSPQLTALEGVGVSQVGVQGEHLSIFASLDNVLLMLGSFYYTYCHLMSWRHLE